MEWSRQKLGCRCPDRSTEHHWDDYQKTSHAVRTRGQIGRHHSSASDHVIIASYCCQVQIPARRCLAESSCRRPRNSWIMHYVFDLFVVRPWCVRCFRPTQRTQSTQRPPLLLRFARCVSCVRCVLSCVRCVRCVSCVGWKPRFSHEKF